MPSETFLVEEGLELDSKNVIRNPHDDFYIDFLKPYYVFTKDGQYLFACTQAGRRPDRAFYMVPDGYKLGKRQRPFDVQIGKKLYEVAKRYLRTARVISLDGIQGEAGYEVGLRFTISVENPHSAYIAWMAKMMVFPPKEGMEVHCWNYVIPEPLPQEYIDEIKEFWPEYDSKEPITLYDVTEMGRNVRQVLSLGIDYFGGAFKKPNLTMVWNKGELEGLVSYHAGCTSDRVLKGLSGTGKTTLTVGLELEQDDACFGKPILEDGKMTSVELIGLEAASFAKSEGLYPESPEWPGLMKSTEIGEDGKRPIVLAMNIDCDGVDFGMKKIGNYEVKIPQQIEGQDIGSLTPMRYEKSKTTNGRFIFLFSELNPDWGSGKSKYLKTESLSFKRFDVLEPVFRVTDPAMAVALDSGCESIITSAIAAQKVGTRVRSYAATDFMVGEQSRQAVLKLKMYTDMGLDLDGKLVFFINNAGFVGEYDIHGDQIRELDEDGEPIPKMNEETGEVEKNQIGEVLHLGQGEKITVQDSKRLVDLVEHRKISNWIRNPVYGYLVPEPKELEEVHGMIDFGKRFNPLNYYSAGQIVEFAQRDIKERTEFLEDLFQGQEGSEELRNVIDVWKKCRVPSLEEIQEFYDTHYVTR
ncbi:MAG: phosphoenolpyruvate carboxykinase (ATP) [Methanobacteriota archaeon]|nr:MAG: phosphoenolpyruvate carboxykinase (ATP) [Euryarchaeota archaeon]